MAPPAISPRSLTTRYFTAIILSAYLVERPTTAVSHIQTRAPGPPATIAVATPAMLPTPTVAESAVINDWKEEISPELLSFFLSKIERSA